MARTEASSRPERTRIARAGERGPGGVADAFELRLTLPADPEALTLVRAAVGGMATALGLEPATVADVRLALTEVCTAAIVRAVAGGGAPVEVVCDCEGPTLRVRVLDSGAPDADALPLPLVAALTETVEVRRLKPPQGRGTEVLLTFALTVAA